MKIRQILLASGLALATTVIPGGIAKVQAGETTKVTNPMLWSDVPDPDIIQVDGTFYLVSTTMHLMPGAPVMESRDLKHWKTRSFIFDKLTDSPKYNMETGTVYGRGQWATSLKYHKGMFYALFAPNDNPGGDTYICTSKDARKWEIHSRLPHFHDASLFFDDDDRVYVFYGNGSVIELNKDLKSVRKDGLNKLLFNRDKEETGLLEGSRMIKKDGKYYLLMISWPAGKPRRQLCYRADSLSGSWEKKVILESTFGGFPYVGQGTIVDGPDGNWYGVIFQDRGGVGRVLTLNPCRWENGWPVLGDAQGRVPDVVEVSLPEQQGIAQQIVSNEEFDDNQFSIRNWEWNHNPVDSKWSVNARKGWLRLSTGKVVSNIFAAPNTLSQRMEGPACTGTIKLDITRMKDGDVCGFSALNGDASMIEISRSGKSTTLAMKTSSVSLTDREKAITGVKDSVYAKTALKSNVVYLRINADFHPGKDMATYEYSIDGKNFKSLGSPVRMIFDYRRFFMGTRFAIYNYATRTAGGSIDVDWFHYHRADK